MYRRLIATPTLDESFHGVAAEQPNAHTYIAADNCSLPASAVLVWHIGLKHCRMCARNVVAGALLP